MSTWPRSPTPSGPPQTPRSVPRLREPRYSQSLERGLAILSAFTPERPVLGIAEIAEELGMSRSTTHRYVITLLALGYLEQGASRKYRLGLDVTRLGMAALGAMPLHEFARPHLEELRERCPYTTHLGVLDGEEVVLVERVHGVRRGRHAIERTLGAGSRLPLHATAIGKLLLAHLRPHEQRELLASMELTPYGPRTITDRRRLREELERIRERGLATASEEITAHLHALAAPVRDETGEVVAGLNLLASDSTIALPELVEQAGPQLCATAERISERLGYRRAGGQEQ